MIFPCEKAVWYYLPQIRADLAIGMVKTGMTQSEAAKKLGVTPAAVSQYVHRKRGLQMPRTRRYRQEITDAVQRIRGEISTEELNSIVCGCCQLLKQEGEECAGAQPVKNMIEVTEQV